MRLSSRVQVVLAAELVHPVELDVRPTVWFSTLVVPCNTAIVIDCVAGETYAGLRPLLAVFGGTTIAKRTLPVAPFACFGSVEPSPPEAAPPPPQPASKNRAVNAAATREPETERIGISFMAV